MRGSVLTVCSFGLVKRFGVTASAKKENRKEKGKILPKSDEPDRANARFRWER